MLFDQLVRCFRFVDPSGEDALPVVLPGDYVGEQEHSAGENILHQIHIKLTQVSTAHQSK